ncbi:Zinc transport protein ZntB [Granulosicoccus antarcticus IMCC3135]|uniref:Zinc transport protein ZntB n=2 Tax=Granulosicoccus TaxID=437504 RepID=A0A2Z2NJU7_9GAMM|nr:Zinc transport protein ZntB [Granulosicoccus antarcticus IMCC3135]
MIFGFSVQADGRVIELDWEAVKQLDVIGVNQWHWVHLNRLSPEAQAWLRERGAPDDQVLAALLQEDTRPRIVRHEDGFLLNLRGVNLNDGANPEDMISLRMWATEHYVITTRAHRILAAEDVRDLFRAGNPPDSSGSLISLIVKRLVARMGPVIAEMDDEVDELEEQLLTTSTTTSRASVSAFRRMVVTLRRYMSPQREALAGFLRDSDEFLVGDDRHSLRDSQDALIRLLEDLDMIRERALLLQEQIVEQRGEAMNARLFVLSVISAVFLPLGFFTGLFGVNVAGMPGVENPLAFGMLCLAMVLFALLIVWLFRRLRWI